MVLHSQTTHAIEPPALVAFDETWRSIGGVQGGLALGTLVRRVEQETGRTAAAATGHFHRPVEAGEARVDVDVHRHGRTVTSAYAALTQTSTRLSAHVLLADAADGEPPESIDDSLFAAGPDEAEPLALPVSFVPFSRYVEYRPVGATRPLGGGTDAFLAAWVRLRTDHPELSPWTAASTAVVLDALPPSLFATRTSPIALPTVEFTMHLSGRAPAGEWLQLRQRLRWSANSLCQDDAELRDHSGTLIGTARQLRLAPSVTSG